MLRNLLVLVRQKWKLDKVQILCYREVQSRRDEARSIVLRLQSRDSNQTSDTSTTTEGRLEPPQMPKVTGWERNREGKLASKFANLAEYLDPHR